MGTEAPLGFDDHHEIASVLDEAREQGLISDYLVSWRSQDGRLEPKVAVWSDALSPTQALRAEILRSLLGLVPSKRIVVIDDDDATARENSRVG